MTSGVSEVQPSFKLDNKGLISDQLWERLVNRIISERSIPRSLAERIMDQTLAFLRLVSDDPNTSYSPSSHVDIGWHTFILYTKSYADFCQRHAGRFIHHEPFDEEGVEYGSGNIVRTVEALKRRGITVDDPLWADSKVRCYCTCSGGD